MADPTEVDVTNSGKFSDANTRIRLIRRIYEKAPHIVSHLKWEIRKATHKDYYMPAAIEHACMVVDIFIEEDLCEILSCNASKEKRPCDPDDPASYYHIGDDGYGIQCQPSCFHSAAVAEFDKNDKKKRVPDTYFLNWNELGGKNGECRIVDTQTINWQEKPYYRSEVHYQYRINDMPTGYSLQPATDPMGSGRSYHPNDAFCAYFNRIMEEDESCSLEWWEKGLDAVVGMSLINTVKSGFNVASTRQPFKDPKIKPSGWLPDTIPEKFTLNGWKKNINKDFKLPQLIDTSPCLASGKKVNATDRYHPDDRENEIIIKRLVAEIGNEDLSNFMRNQFGRKLDTSPTRIYGLNKNGQIVGPMEKPYDPLKDFKSMKKNDEPKDIHWTEKMADIIGGLVKMVTESKFWIDMAVTKGSAMMTKYLKKFAIKMIDKIAVRLSDGLLRLIGSVGQRVLLVGIKGLIARLMTHLAFSIVSKVAVILAKMLASAASVIGLVLWGMFIFDLLFTIWDPYGYNNMFPPEMPKEMMENGELALRSEMQVISPTYQFDHLVDLLISQEEKADIMIESLEDRMIYIDSLTVNSEGSTIEKGKEFDVSRGSRDEMDFVQAAAMAKRHKFTPETFQEYNGKFMTRVKLNKYMNYAGAIAILTSGIFITILNLPIICMVLLIVGVIILALGRLELHDDVLVDLLDKYENAGENRVIINDLELD